MEALNPAISTRLWPGNDEAWARRATLEFAKIPDAAEVLAQPGAKVADLSPLLQTMEFSRRALGISGLQVAALRNIAYAYLLSAEIGKMQTVLVAADNVTRRDLPTQILLTRQHFADQNLERGLASFDRALRISDRGQEQLFPLLVEVVKMPQFRPAFQPYLRPDNRWLADFLEFALVNKLAMGSIGEMIAEAGSLPSRPGSEIRSFAPAYLVAAGEPELARRIAMQAPRPERPAEGGGLSDPTFSDPRIIAPFGWSLSDSSEVNIYPPSAGQPLEISSPMAYSGDLATQMINLQPGRYVLSSSGKFGDNVAWFLRCETTGRELVSNARNASVAFTVPAQGCRAQWLRLQGQALGKIDATINRIDIRPAGAAVP